MLKWLNCKGYFVCCVLLALVMMKKEAPFGWTNNVSGVYCC